MQTDLIEFTKRFLTPLSYCDLDGEAIIDTERICYDLQGRKFHNLEEADQYDQMLSAEVGSPYSEDIGTEGYKPWMN